MSLLAREHTTRNYSDNIQKYFSLIDLYDIVILQIIYKQGGSVHSYHGMVEGLYQHIYYDIVHASKVCLVTPPPAVPSQFQRWSKLKGALARTNTFAFNRRPDKSPPRTKTEEENEKKHQVIT
jgi:hypothetical protein